MSTAEILVEIALRFATLSLVAIGGINAILPEIQREVIVRPHQFKEPGDAIIDMTK